MRMFALIFMMTACATDVVENKTESQEAIPTETQAESKAAPSEWKMYGDAFTLESSSPGVAVLSSPEKFVNKTVRITGTVSDVCQKMGCWMVVSEGEHHMRVIMKDHAFAVNKSGSGFDCDIEGVVTAKAVDPDETAHYASESRPGAVVPEQDLKAQDTVYHLVASGVRMKQSSKDTL